MYYCYVLRCADGTLYTGVTTDIARRVEEHNGGKGARCRRVWPEVGAEEGSLCGRCAATVG